MTNRKRPNIAIIVVTYNSVHYLPKLFQTLHAQSYKGELGFIVVDNNSHDTTTRYIQEKEKRVLLLPQDRNRGFARGVNIGIERALDHGADAVILLNPDTFVERTFVETLVHGAYAKKDIATAQPLVLLAKEPETINTAGNCVHYLGFGYGDMYREHISAAAGRGVFDCTYGSGAALLIKRESIERYGMLMDSYFMYHEDLEYGMRMLLAGQRNVVVPESRVYHFYSFEKSVLKYYFMERNRHRFFITFYSIKTLLVLFPIYIITEIALFAVSFFANTTRDRIHVWMYFMKISSWKTLLNERRIIQSHRRVTDGEITPFLRDGVYFQDVDTLFARYIANPLWRAYWKLVRGFI